MKKVKVRTSEMLFLVTIIILILSLLEITLVKSSWYNFLIIINLICLRKYTFKNSKSYSLDKIVNTGCVVGILLCIISLFQPFGSKYYNYMYSPNKTHKIVIAQSSRNRDGYLDIYEQHFFLFKSRKMGLLEVKSGHPLMTVELSPEAGNVFSGKDYYSIGQLDFKWVTEDELVVIYNPNHTSTSISIKF